jgi:hypothetical protein
MEEMVADDIDTTIRNKETGTASWYHYRGVFDGLRIDVSHHTSMGTLPWTSANAANKLAALTIFLCAEDYRRRPDVLLRGHRHTYEDSFGAFSTRAILMPCWTLKSAYAHKVATNELPDIGGAIITLDGKDCDIDIVRYTLAGDVEAIWRE